MSELSIKPEGDQGMIRIRADRPGERAVSVLVTTEQAIQVLEELAGLIGYTVTPTGSSSTSIDL